MDPATVWATLCAGYVDVDDPEGRLLLPFDHENMAASLEVRSAKNASRNEKWRAMNDELQQVIKRKYQFISSHFDIPQKHKTITFIITRP
jgi:hypothetical protein